MLACLTNASPDPLPGPSQGSLPAQAGSPLAGRDSHPLDGESKVHRVIAFLPSLRPALPGRTPVLSLLNRESDPRDGFAADCGHRQLDLVLISGISSRNSEPPGRFPLFRGVLRERPFGRNRRQPDSAGLPRADRSFSPRPSETMPFGCDLEARGGCYRADAPVPSRGGDALVCLSGSSAGFT
jgi:hypothetical protein